MVTLLNDNVDVLTLIYHIGGVHSMNAFLTVSLNFAILLVLFYCLRQRSSIALKAMVRHPRSVVKSPSANSKIYWKRLV